MVDNFYRFTLKFNIGAREKLTTRIIYAPSYQEALKVIKSSKINFTILDCENISPEVFYD